VTEHLSRPDGHCQSQLTKTLPLLRHIAANDVSTCRERADVHNVPRADPVPAHGVVATLMKTGLDLAAVYAHYRKAAEQALTNEQLVEVDRRLLQEHSGPGRPTVIGLDVAPNAVG
jgi:hypothetical protein